MAGRDVFKIVLKSRLGYVTLETDDPGEVGCLKENFKNNPQLNAERLLNSLTRRWVVVDAQFIEKGR